MNTVPQNSLPDLSIPVEAIVTQLVSQRAGENASARAKEDPELREVQAKTSALAEKVLSVVGRELYSEFEEASGHETAIFEDYVYRQGFMDGMKFIMAMK